MNELKLTENEQLMFDMINNKEIQLKEEKEKEKERIKQFKKYRIIKELEEKKIELIIKIKLLENLSKEELINVAYTGLNIYYGEFESYSLNDKIILDNLDELKDRIENWSKSGE